MCCLGCVGMTDRKVRLRGAEKVASYGVFVYDVLLTVFF